MLGRCGPARLGTQCASLLRGRKLDYKETELTDKHESPHVEEGW